MINVSIQSSPEVVYPPEDEFFSPHERYPEYRFEHLAAHPNGVYALLRQTLFQAGLDREHYGTAQWNPLGRFIAPGQKVFVLCNFVYHRRGHDSTIDFFSKCTHGSVLRALLDYVLIAVGPGTTVRFGNSSSQECVWERVLSDSRADRVAQFFDKQGAAVKPTDLRLHVTEKNFLGRIQAVHVQGEPADAVEIDLAADSLLAGLRGGRSAPFRVTNYDPRRIEAFHAGDAHRYIVHRRVLESDVVFSLPKLKTHEKVGITCGLKGFVGTVGHKDCLAHYRFGNPRIGGDEYPDSQAVLRPLSRFLDWINTRGQDAALQNPLKILSHNAYRVLRRLGATIGGGWHGNDTAWRMALDLARIVHYADAAGAMQARPQRKHVMLLDGIVAGERNGPLSPTPRPTGTLILSDNVAVGDRVACRLMGFDPRRIPLIFHSSRLERYPIVPPGDSGPRIVFNGAPCPEERLAPLGGRPFQAPKRWRDVLENPPATGDRQGAASVSPAERLP